MESLELHTGASTEHWEYNTTLSYVLEAKIVTPRVKHIEITVCFLQEKLTMVSISQDMRSLLPLRQIIAPNHDKI